MRHAQPDCARPDCTIPHRHLTDEPHGDCRGCMPAQAAPGLALCGYHANRIKTQAMRLHTLDRDLEHVMAGSGNPLAEFVTSKGDDPNLKLNYAAVESRAEIRAWLRATVALIVRERGFTAPGEDTRSQAMFVGGSCDWLAARPDAAVRAIALDELVSRAHPIAYPSGVRMFEVAPCPGQDGVPCDGVLWAVLRPKATVELPSALICNAEARHEWPPTTWMRLGLRLQTTRSEVAA